MSAVEQTISIRLKKEMATALATIDRTKLLKDLADKIVALVIKRTSDGYDLQSRRFGNYNAGYDKREALKYAKKKQGTTKFSSTSKSDKLRLTGNLMSSLETNKGRITIKSNGIFITFKVFVTGAKNIKKAEGLQSTTGYTKRGSYSKKSYEFMGMATSGKYSEIETKALQNIIVKAFREKTQIKVTKK